MTLQAPLTTTYTNGNGSRSHHAFATPGRPKLDASPYRGKPEMEYRRLYIHLGDINVLAQPRRTFSDISELAQTVASLLYANPPVVVAFSNLELLNGYLIEASSYWDQEITQNDLTHKVNLEGRPAYIINLAGERRLRAARHLFEKGCETCQKEEFRGDCLNRHFQLGSGIIETRVILNPDPKRCFQLQLMENTTQRPVPFAEQAQADHLYLKYMRIRKPEYSLRDLAKETGRSITTLRKELAFVELPWAIQEAVHGKKIAAVIATEIGRLKSCIQDLTDEKLIQWMDRAITCRYNGHEMREAIDAFLEEKLHGQLNMLDFIMTPEEMSRFNKAENRRHKAQRISQALQAEMNYIAFVTRQEDEDLEESPLTLPSTSRNTRHLAQQIENFVNQLRPLVSGSKAQYIQGIAHDLQRITAIVELSHAAGYSSLVKVPDEVLKHWFEMSIAPEASTSSETSQTLVLL